MPNTRLGQHALDSTPWSKTTRQPRTSHPAPPALARRRRSPTPSTRAAASGGARRARLHRRGSGSWRLNVECHRGSHGSLGGQTLKPPLYPREPHTLHDPVGHRLPPPLPPPRPPSLQVFDLGGGTFDVSIVDIGGDGGGGIVDLVRVVATAGDPRLGGNDWDEAVADWLAGDAAEMQPRCSRDTAEMLSRCGRDTAEMLSRCCRDAADMSRCCRAYAEPEPSLRRGAGGAVPRGARRRGAAWPPLRFRAAAAARRGGGGQGCSLGRHVGRGVRASAARPARPQRHSLAPQVRGDALPPARGKAMAGSATRPRHAGSRPSAGRCCCGWFPRSSTWRRPPG